VWEVWAVIVVRSSRGGVLRVDGFRIRVVERLALPSIWARLKAIRGAGWNTFLLRADDVFLDMLTDSGVNAMSDRQLAAMITAQDAYAGGRSYYELDDAVR
jgi:tryptophanase